MGSNLLKGVGFALIASLVFGASPIWAQARQAPPMETASVARMPAMAPHWVWIPDRLIQHNMLYDGDTGEVLGMLDSPSLLTPKTPLVVPARSEIYSVDIAHSRGLRGDRIDFVSIYDLATLDYVAEIVVPTLAGSSNASLAYAELIGDRFLGIFNQFPEVSVSIVDLVERRFVEAIPIGGCAGIFPVDAQHFASLCGDGSTLLVSLDAEGRKVSFVQSERFFDVLEDPVFMAAGRSGQSWTFVSFRGAVTHIDYASGAPQVGETWSMLSDADRDARWRPGGLQHVALHAETNRLYVVMHQGDAGSHKEAGPEIWVYDLDAQTRTARYGVPNLTVSFLASFMGVPVDGFAYMLLEWILPTGGAHTIAVSQDAEPVLFVRNAMLGSVGVLDASNGESLRFLTETGLAGPTLRVP
jgi:methylamine dehydrogenase heavy chain